jgi:hypothetical protein
MAKYDITKTNDGIDRLLAVTTNPRHRFMLQAYYRHRFLEIAGRYDEIFVPEMTVEKSVYHVPASGQHTKLEGQDAVKREVNSGQRKAENIENNGRKQGPQTDRDAKAFVVALKSCGVQQETIARIVGVSVPSLRKWYAAELQDGLACAVAGAATNMFRLALKQSSTGFMAVRHVLRCFGGPAWDVSPRRL